MQHQQQQQQFLQIQLRQQQVRQKLQQQQSQPQQNNQFKLIEGTNFKPSEFINTAQPNQYEPAVNQEISNQSNSNFYIQKNLTDQSQQSQSFQNNNSNENKQQNNSNIKVFQINSGLMNENSNNNNAILIQQQQQQIQQQNQAVIIRTQESLQPMNNHHIIKFNPDQQQQSETILFNQQQQQSNLEFQPIKLIQDHTLQTTPVKPIQLQALFAQPSQLNQHVTSTSNTVSKEEIHVDSIINEVASGFGNIPYGTDFDDEETSSSYKDTILSDQSKF